MHPHWSDYMTDRALVLSVILLIACGDDSSGDGDSGSAADDGTGADDDDDDSATSVGSESGGVETDGGSGSDSVDSGSESESGGVDPTPVLEREPAISHTCAETRAMMQYPAGEQSRTEGLALAGGEFSVLGWSPTTIDIRRVGLDGAVGDPVVLEPQEFVATYPTMTADGDEIAAVWSVGGFADKTVRFARLDADLVPIVPAMDIPETTGLAVELAAIAPASAGGLALFYGQGQAQTVLRFMPLAADGQSDGPAVDIADIGETYGLVSASVAPTADGGYAVAYVTSAADGGEVFFVVLDGDGTPRFEPQRISREAGDGWSSGFGRARSDVLPVGERFWVAHTEEWIDYESQMGHAIVKIAIVDGDGASESHVVQAPVEGRENRWPSLVHLDDRVGLVWTQGTIIWICGGCIGDHDLHFVLIDPDAVVPASEVVTQLHTTNGIVAPIAAVGGGDILTASSLDFHALTQPASGALHCDSI
jgi:hypothetical protein